MINNLYIDLNVVLRFSIALPLSVLSLLISCLWPILFVPKICLLDWLLLIPPTYLLFSSNSCRQQDCNEETSSTMVARLRCQRVSNLLQFGSAISLTMTMAVHQQSPQILDSDKTAITGLHSNLLNDCCKTAISARQQSPSIWRRIILDNGNGSTSEIFSNSWWW